MLAMSEELAPAIALMIPAIVLILVGATCLAIGFVVKLVKTDSKNQPPA